jgi:hypothetical protein
MSGMSRSNNWLGRMVVAILLEKIFAFLFFACVNSIIPFGAEWLRDLLLALPGFLVIDVLYGRIVFYSAAGALFKLSKSTSRFLEPSIYFLSLLLSLGVVIAVTGQVQILLFFGKHPWNCMAYYLIMTSGVIAALLAWHNQAKTRQALTLEKSASPST